MTAALDLLVTASSAMLAVAASIFILYSLDEFGILIAYAAWYWRRGRSSRRRPLSAVALHGTPERRIAILLPAWHESDVIRRMLESNLARLDYQNYRIFVGVYPNDPATRREVEAVAAAHPRVGCVVTARPGPTTKGDCLNQLYAAALHEQETTGDVFDAFVLDDAEDVMPPLELRAINQFLPEMDVIQLPVLPIPVAARYVTAAHYGDEFAALHARELPVREWISGAVPSAGVGTGFSARALALASANGEGPFSLTSLTEDYDLTMRLANLGTRQTFVIEALFRPEADRTGRPIDDAIAIREYFPKRLRAAIRQKGRWIVGNALQGWQQLGWGRGWGRRYFFFRDRKVLVGHLATGLAGLAVLGSVAAWIARWLWLGDGTYPRVVAVGGRVDAMIRASLVLMVIFLAVRASFVAAVYGPAQAVLSIPRAIWGGWINFAASLRALYVFSTQRRPRWDKTAHEFPDQAAAPPSVRTSPNTRSAPE